MIVDVKIVVGRICPCPRGAFAVCAVHAVLVGRIDAAVKVFVEILHMFYAEVALERESLYGVHLDEAISEYTPAVVTVVAAIVDGLYWICEVRTAKCGGTCEIAVDIIYRYCRML